MPAATQTWAWILLGSTLLSFASGVAAMWFAHVSRATAVAALGKGGQICLGAMWGGFGLAVVSTAGLGWQATHPRGDAVLLRPVRTPVRTVTLSEGEELRVTLAEGKKLRVNFAGLVPPGEIPPGYQEYTFCVCIPVDGLQLLGPSGLWQLWKRDHCHRPDLSPDRAPEPAEYWVYKHVVALDPRQAVPPFPKVHLKGQNAGEYKIGLCWGPGSFDPGGGERAMQALQNRQGGGRDTVIAVVSRAAETSPTP